VEVEGNVPYGVLKFEVEGDGLKVDSTYAHFRPFNPFLSVSSWRLDFSFAQFDPETGDYYEVARSDDSWHGATGALSIGRYGPGFEFPEGKEGLACVTFTWKSGHGTLQETHCHKVKPSGGGLFGLF
jgi:hypothetical protein